MTLWDDLTRANRSHATFRCWVGDGFEESSWPQVARDAERMTAGLRAAGVADGARVAAILTNGPQVARGVLAVWLAGGAIASLPVPARGMSGEEYADQLTSLCEHVEATLLLVEESLIATIPPALRPIARSWESFAGTGTVEPSPPDADALAFIQYSSGSTSAPKGCMLTTRAIEAQIDLLARMMAAAPGDTAVTWLPLSHDMGMFGSLLTPWAHDFSLVLSTPQRFMYSPGSWFSDVSCFGATMTAGTNTALHLAARMLRRARIERPLQVRVCFVGAERVQVDTLAFATSALAPCGFRPEAWMPAYGLAEATLAVTATPVDERPRHLVVDGIALADGAIEEVEPDSASATAIVSAGVPGRGVELVDAPDDRIGEIRVRSPSLASGYHGEPELTRARFEEGVLRTNDLGFVRDGHLYPVGRLDDVISVAGRNVYAREIEAAIDELPPVRRGCTAIVDTGEAGRLALLVEVNGALRDHRALAEEAASIAMAKAAVPLSSCVLLRKGTLPKTPSGKIQRHRCRHMLAAGRFAPVATVELVPA